MGESSASDWYRARKVFEEVLKKPKVERMQFARERCGSDKRLWEEVSSLVGWHESSESFLETPAIVRLAEESIRPNQLVPGQQLLHYKISELIGKGGMGEVYLARDTKLDRNVAIKLLREDLLPQVRTGDRLLREARAAALLEHPNICHIYEISEADGFNFIVMQYIVGTTLDELLSAGGTDVDTALRLGEQIAAGLAEAHSQGLIHRDIKPANIIITEKKQAKILDFGLAKFIEVESRADGVSRMESTGGVMGTIPYMSPEQLSGREVDARTDVFSLGSLLFEMIGCVPAFRRENNENTVSAILKEQPVWSSIPILIRPLIERCLAKNPEDRYSSATEVADALSAARKQQRIEGSNPSRQADAKRKAAATDQSEVRTARYAMPGTQALDFPRITGEPKPEEPPNHEHNRGSVHPAARFSKGRPKTVGRYRYPSLKTVLIGGLGAIVLSAGLLGYNIYIPSQEVGKENETSASTPRKLYWEHSYMERRDLVRKGVAQVQMLIGDDQRAISEESLDGISKEIEWYVSRRDSLSQDPFRDGLRAVYGRASQYVALISGEYEKDKVPIAIGIYQALIESEYRDCLENVTGPTGIFQLTKGTAEQYGLAAKDRCRVDLSSKAAAAYVSKLFRDFGNESSSWTLAVLSFSQGGDLTAQQLRKLVELGINERNYWVISENRERFDSYDQRMDQYLSRFFAAAIIGENPEMFGLVTPPLSTIRTRSDLAVPSQTDLAAIPGGSFNMGRNGGTNENEKPEHRESISGFRMSKTEVTNIEFAEFIVATGYKPEDSNTNFLAHWVNGRPLEREEMHPVRFVNLADINAFIKWKSQNDGTQYRLPTEQEWEYAARNGSRNNRYPWGDRFDARCAVVDQPVTDPVAVGTHSCPNQWGMQDLIGNVFEWTNSRMSLYPGNVGELVPRAEPYYMVRGGSAFQKSSGPQAITSTFRVAVPASRRSAELGFRLVASP